MLKPSLLTHSVPCSTKQTMVRLTMKFGMLVEYQFGGIQNGRSPCVPGCHNCLYLEK
jgi:hypothetical protein